MEKGYAGKGTRLGTFFVGAIVTSIGLTSVFSDWANAHLPPSPDAVIEAEPPAAIPPTPSPSAPPPPSPSEIAQGQLDELIHAWRDAWASRDTDTYLAFYAENFNGNAETPEKWRANRKRIIGQAKYIGIKTGPAEITLKDADSATIVFPLDYASDRFEDHGTKVLEVRRQDGKWLIEGERFTAND